MRKEGRLSPFTDAVIPAKAGIRICCVAFGDSFHSPAFAGAGFTGWRVKHCMTGVEGRGSGKTTATMGAHFNNWA